MVSTTHYSLKAVSLKKAPTMGTVGRMYIPRTGADEDSPTAQGQLSGQPSVIFSQRPPPTLHPSGPTLPTLSHTPPSSAMCWRGQQGVSLAWGLFIWWLSFCLGTDVTAIIEACARKNTD